MIIAQRHLPSTKVSRRIDAMRMFVVAATLTVLPAAHAVGPVIAMERVSVTSGGGSMQGDSFFSAISADGRYVAFDSASTDLVPGTMHPGAQQRTAAGGIPQNVY